jgi:alkanesulfonate monooxygenase SsuD/methylene tetrahydromethanopterin reductase-like flavin-dependent oxidoreductase (luciferase family)
MPLADSSSLFGAQLLAATLGLPYAFASHFAPTHLQAAADLYRREFRPSEHLQRPHVMLGFNVFAADSATRKLSCWPPPCSRGCRER